LNWCIRGCLDWQKHGLGEPQAIVDATASYRTEQDVIGSFIGEKCGEGSCCCIKASELYGHYERWCKDNGEHPVSGRRFGQAMSERGYERYTNNGTWYRGIEIVE